MLPKVNIGDEVRDVLVYIIKKNKKEKSNKKEV